MNSSLLIAGYLLVYALAVVAIWVWRVNRRQERPPTPERLLRGPGESLRAKLERFDDQLLLHLLVGAVAPLLVMALGLYGIGRVSEAQQSWLIVFLLAAVTVALFFSGRWLVILLDRRRNHYLGYFGERVVGEKLDALRTLGFAVFHDVPATEAKPAFNLDHVVVGPTGVFAIETKTRRKGAVKPGLAEHKILANGQALLFPWGEDSHGLKACEARARWLQEWLVQNLGQAIPVVPVLVFPGWWVEEKGVGRVRVVNPTQLVALVRGNTGTLGDEHVAFIARQLEARCRDVEF
ncbi:NERD domain-containing protein [Nibricoccus sp. IMCC34717]|uniref:NERD domain-containing protein n=1 Tax=Nibricoccus sp. IMCC34717 TaxID=3034021 RepID=UPI00384D91DE